jgi:hypothetical protein
MKKLFIAIASLFLCLTGQFALAQYTLDFSFDYSNGYTAVYPPTLVSSAWYGVTYSGGSNGHGVLYECSSTPCSSSNFSVLYDFTSTNGNPSSPLIADSSGNLYGVTELTNGGILFEYSSSGFSQLFAFNGTNGANPTGHLALDTCPTGTDTCIYGTTVGGGTHSNGGTIWDYDLTAASGPTILYNFDQSHSPGLINPEGGLVFNPAGTILYGTATNSFSGSGGIWSYDPYNAVYKTIDAFTATGDFYNPQGALFISPNGNYLYGTSVGGVNDVGNVWEYDLANKILTKIAAYTNADGSYPAGKPLQVGVFCRGNASVVCTSSSTSVLYATATLAGSGYGGIYKVSYTSGTWTQSSQHLFSGPTSDGSSPGGDLIGVSSHVYTVTSYGGANVNSNCTAGCGAIIQVQ